MGQQLLVDPYFLVLLYLLCSIQQRMENRKKTSPVHEASSTGEKYGLSSPFGVGTGNNIFLRLKRPKKYVHFKPPVFKYVGFPVPRSPFPVPF